MLPLLYDQASVTQRDAQLAELTKGTLATLADAKATDEARIDAARQVVALQPDDDATASQILAAVKPQTAPALAAGLFDALSASTAKGIGAALVARLLDLPPAARTAAGRTSSPASTRCATACSLSTAITRAWRRSAIFWCSRRPPWT